jgi:hypothetical protein
MYSLNQGKYYKKRKEGFSQLANKTKEIIQSTDINKGNLNFNF